MWSADDSTLQCAGAVRRSASSEGGARSVIRGVARSLALRVAHCSMAAAAATAAGSAASRAASMAAMMAVSLASSSVSFGWSGRMMTTSMFLAPESTTSRSVLTVRSSAASSSRPSTHSFSRNSRIDFALRPPIALAFQEKYVPEGSIWYICGCCVAASKPTMSEETPKGRTPPRCVYRCCVAARKRAMYSTDGASSHVRRYDWASTRALFTRTRASAVRPAKASVILSSSLITLRIVRASWSLATALRSTPRTTQAPPRTPTAAAPFFTASNA
mmetsp:Transcript_22278/g.75320  ORF Transcript_22278/g.75320 Transcript_22278/m.75320 type:complete len:274 (+) Transcript_22278:104-925(+)